jgi:D-glycero-D-manno-heptose 1,7-bisphosphate phosphatase
MTKAVFLDRDGTLNKDQGYVHKTEDFELLPGVIEGLKILQDDFIFIIISNQSGIGRGYYTEEDFFAFNNLLVETLAKEGIKIQSTYFCPHLKEEKCDCRKPNTKYIDLSVIKYNINKAESWMIGDHPSDIILGNNAGIKTVFLLTGHGSEHTEDLKKKNINPTFIAEDFLSAAKFINGNL